MLRLWGRRVERDSDCLTCLWDPSLTGINTLKRDSPTPCAANWRNVPENLLWVSWFLSLTRNSKRLQRRQAKSWSLGTATVSCWVPPFLLKRKWCFLLTISWVRRASWGLSEVCILGNHMDRRAWWATAHGGHKELDTTEHICKKTQAVRRYPWDREFEASDPPPDRTPNKGTDCT